jgi:diaminopimelate decarboxylase
MSERQWTDYIKRASNGHLWVENCDCAEIVKEYGTPLFVYSENQLRKNYHDFKNAFSEVYDNIIIAAGIKANNLLAIRRILAQEGAGADCFVGELEVAMMAGIKPSLLYLNGSNKQLSELEAAIELGVTINVDNIQELEIIKEILSYKTEKEANVCIRVKLPLEGLSNEFIRDYRYHPPEVSIRDWALGYKFGMDEDTALAALRIALESPNVIVRGIHYHLKSQTLDPKHYTVAINELIKFMLKVRKQLDWEPEILDLGGGFGYGRQEGYGGGGEALEAPTFSDFAQAIMIPLMKGIEEHRFKRPAIVLEPGRVMVANSAVLLTTVGSIKEMKSLKRKWIHVDASTNSLMRIRTSNWYYHVVHALKNEKETENYYDGLVEIVGPLCDAADILSRNVKIEPIFSGDLLAYLDVGAYTESTLCHFNSQPRPASVLVNKDKTEIIVRRETVHDIVNVQKIPARLWATKSTG